MKPRGSYDPTIPILVDVAIPHTVLSCALFLTILARVMSGLTLSMESDREHVTLSRVFVLTVAVLQQLRYSSVAKPRKTGALRGVYITLNESPAPFPSPSLWVDNNNLWCKLLSEPRASVACVSDGSEHQPPSFIPDRPRDPEYSKLVQLDNV
jgi:hypothetical protein